MRRIQPDPIRNGSESWVSLGMPIYSHQSFEGCHTTQHGFLQLGELLAELSARANGSPVLILSEGIHIDAELIKAAAR